MMISEVNTESFISYMKRMRQHYKGLASEKDKPYFDDIEVDASSYGFFTNDINSHDNNIRKTPKKTPKPTEIKTIDLFDQTDIARNSANKVVKEKKSFFITKIIKAIFS